MISFPESIQGPASTVSPFHCLGDIPGALSRLFESSEPASALIVSSISPEEPAILSIKRRPGALPLFVILTDRLKTSSEAKVRDFFRGRALPLAEGATAACLSGVRPLIYTLTVPVEAMAGIASDLLKKCFSVGDDVPLDFNFVRS